MQNWNSPIRVAKSSTRDRENNYGRDGRGEGKEEKKKTRKIVRRVKKNALLLIRRKNCPSDEKLFKERKMQWLRKDKCDSFIFESIFIRFLPRSNSTSAQREKVFQLTTKAGWLLVLLHKYCKLFNPNRKENRV